MVEELGSKSSSILTGAIDDFAKTAGEDASGAAYDRGVDEIAAAVDAQLQVLYLRQLALLRENALQSYRAATKTTGSKDPLELFQPGFQSTSCWLSNPLCQLLEGHKVPAPIP